MTYYTDRISYIDGSKGNRSKYGSKKAYRKDEPYLCKKCNKVWQQLRDYASRSDYLIGFPKIGCTKRICYNCINERNKDSSSTHIARQNERK